MTKPIAEESAESARVVMVYGADSRLGQKVVSYLERNQQGFIPRASDFFDDRADIATAIHLDIRQKKPTVVVNCLIDPDCGFLPYQPIRKYVSTAHAMVQQCRITGVRLIHCSSAQVYGQREQIMGRAAYGEYDPALCVGRNVWRPVLHGVETALWQQTCLYNSAPMSSTHSKFELYLLRLGHMIESSSSRYAGQPVDDCLTLDVCVRKALGDLDLFACVDPEYRISPITVDYAAECIIKLCRSVVSAPSGTYNIGAASNVTLKEFINYLSMRTSKCLSVCTLNDTCPANTPMIAGIDSDQALDSLYAAQKLGLKLPGWKAAVDGALAGKALAPVI